MSQNLAIVLVVIALVAVLVGLLVWRRRSNSKPTPSLETPVTPTAGLADNVSTHTQPTGQPSAISTAPEVEQVDPIAQSQPISTTEFVEQAEIVEPPVPPIEQVKPRSLRHRLGRSQGVLTSAFKGLFSSDGVTEAAWTDLEDTLIMADMGASGATRITDQLKTAVKKSNITDADALFTLASDELTKIVDGGFSRALNLKPKDNLPAVALVVGVNGTGKTTTTAKIAHLLSGQDFEVLLGAADTFRAAAAEQLTTWANRIGVQVVRGEEGSDPASVAFNAVTEGIQEQVDVVLIDTAGRLHTKQGLMDELGKVHRVVSKQATVDEVLLVIDATTGQNGLAQAKVFSEVVPITGVVLSKLDGTAKGGIVVAVQNELNVPVKLVGVGEDLDDLAPFDPAEFVAGLLS